jgi:hypothetical protein
MLVTCYKVCAKLNLDVKEYELCVLGVTAKTVDTLGSISSNARHQLSLRKRLKLLEETNIEVVR